MKDCRPVVTSNAFLCVAVCRAAYLFPFGGKHMLAL